MRRMMLTRRRGRQHGVTLVEVLMVSSFMSGLGGGAYQGALDGARRDVCLNNLKQLGLAIQMFAMDHDDKLPVAAFYPQKDPKNNPQSIRVKLWSYVKSDPIFQCPAAPDVLNSQGGLAYVWNDALNGMLQDQIPNPSQVWMMTDMATTLTALPADVAKQKSINAKVVPPPHVNGYNILYADGHVKWSPTPPVIKPVVQPTRPPAGGGGGGGGGDEDEE